MKTSVTSPLRQRIPVCALKIALCLSVLVLFLSGLTAQANPTIRTAFFSLYPNATNTPLDLGSLVGSSKAEHCGVCHYNFSSGGDPWNPYGQAIKNFGVGGENRPHERHLERAQP